MKLSVGSRASKLAMAQTRLVTSALLDRNPGIEIEVLPVRTRGDRIPVEEGTPVDGKGAFTEDIDSLLVKGEIDIAVHSMKDLPSRFDDRLVIAATPARGDSRDVLVSRGNVPLSGLARGGRVGTSSSRRRTQLLRIRDDIETVELHGNIETRMTKVGRSLDAVVLAAAGLERTSALERVAQYFTIDEMIPAPGQGILAVLARADDRDTLNLVHVIEDGSARIEASCERAFLNALGGDCNVPAGCKATYSNGSVSAIGMIAGADGGEFITKTIRSVSKHAEAVGQELADALLANGGRRLLEEVSNP